MIHELFVPPRLRLPQENPERHTTWLETFYDLVFVVAVSTSSGRLSGNVTLVGVVQFLVFAGVLLVLSIFVVLDARYWRHWVGSGDEAERA